MVEFQVCILMTYFDIYTEATRYAHCKVCIVVQWNISDVDGDNDYDVLITGYGDDT